MVSKNVEKALNDQIKKEEHSSRIYLSMASWCERNGYPGASDFLYVQTEEERLHMLKLVHYLNDRGGNVVVDSLEAPASSWDSLLDVFENVLKHEEFISASINELYAICVKEGDFTSANYLQWYISEQIEEENTARSILDQINLAGAQQGGLFMVDKELATLSATKKSELSGNN